MLHAYCVMPSREVPKGVSGIGGAAVRAVREGGLAIWVSERETPAPADVASIKQHNDVVVAAMTLATPMPFRFGQSLRDDADVHAALQTSHEKWAAALARFADTAEFGIRVFDPEHNAGATAGLAPKGSSGTQYMAALSQRIGGPDRTRRELETALDEVVGGLVKERRIEPLRTAHGVATVAYLVHRANVDAYHGAVEAVRTRMPRLRLLSTGPWPPYSFVE
jgi:hypothetical protein